MAITYPLTIPTTPSSYDITGRCVDAMTASIFTGEQYVYSYDGEWWECSIRWSIGDRTTRSQLIAMLQSLNGRTGTFYFGPYGTEAQSLGAPAGSPLVDGSSQTGKYLATRGWTSSTNVLKAGDWIQVGTRLHKVLEDCTSDSSGNATISLFPQIRVGSLDGDSIIYTNPKGIFRMMSDFSYTFGVGSMYQEINITAREVI